MGARSTAACSRASRPTIARSTASRRRSAATTSRRSPTGWPMIQHRLVKLWDLGVATGRITPNELVDMTSTAIAKRFGLARKGSIAPGKDADLVVFDPSTPFEFSTRTSHMNVDYDLFEGESSTGQRAPHASAAEPWSTTAGEIRTEPGHGRFVPRSLGAHARRGLVRRRPRPRGPARAGTPDRRPGRRAARVLDRRVGARAGVPALTAGRAAGGGVGGRRGQPLGRPPGRAGRLRDRRLARRLRARRRLARRCARRVRRASRRCARGPSAASRRWACGWSTGPTRRARASGAACSAPRPAPARSRWTRCAISRDRDGERLEDVVARYDVDLARAHESHAQLRGARAYIELHIEQGPVLESRGEPAGDGARHLRGRAPRGASSPARRRTPARRRWRCAATRSWPPPRRRWRSARSASATTACLHGRRRDSEPGVITAVAGRTEMLLDQRHLDPDELAAMLAEARDACEQAAADHGCEVELSTSGRSRRSRSTTG